jgi:hypothetical protein
MLLSITSLAVALLPVASIVCVCAGAVGPGDVVFGAYGASAAALGLVLVSNVDGSAVAMERFSEAVRSGPVKLSGRRWTARRYRLLGAGDVVFGCLFAIAGWSGMATWRR